MALVSGWPSGAELVEIPLPLMTYEKAQEEARAK